MPLTTTKKTKVYIFKDGKREEQEEEEDIFKDQKSIGFGKEDSRESSFG